MLWNEPNNESHWDFEIDRDWRIFAEMTNAAADAVHLLFHAGALRHQRPRLVFTTVMLAA